MALRQLHHFEDKVFQSVLEDLLACGRLAGSLHGHGDKGTFVPAIHGRTQHRWVESFYAENGYVGRSALSPQSISQSHNLISTEQSQPNRLRDGRASRHQRRQELSQKQHQRRFGILGGKGGRVV